MRILHVTQHGSLIGGVETYAADLHRLLQRDGHTVVLLHGIAVGESRPAIAPEMLHVPALRPGGGNWAERESALRQVVEQVAPDVILTHDVEEADVLRLFARLRPTVPFVHVHSRSVCPGRGKFYARQKQACVRPFGAYCAIAPYLHACGTRRPWRLLANMRVTRRWIEAAQEMPRLLVASEYMKRELMAVGLAQERIVVNLPFVEAPRDEEASPREPRWTTSETLPLVLFCGRFYDYKGADLLLRALEFVAPPVRAVLIGEGPEQPKLKRLAARVPSRHLVSFPGWLSRTAVFGFYRRARVVVIPSVWPEPFCRVGPEAMRHGAPIVAFRVGAIPEWVREGETGLLVEPANIRALAAAIERVVTDDALAAALSARAAQVAAEQFNAQRHLERLMRTFAAVTRTVG
ncbi:D-inositol 3-phosphate glycosyltransferase [bacterium HR10]|nr:D-inositol 3-phosphate glycosyltransferase [bacterium HR10]